ncbi:MAG: Replication-associated recombination protein A [Glaciecola sp. HTCC2999]|jgi:putative ATPase|nr:MAG: Replication-associated recombination protein A [Glaciecola sp. HTCC2999]
MIKRNLEPLAARMRPTDLASYIGQSNILGPGQPLRESLISGQVHSMLLWGPPGTGKTTLAQIIAQHLDANLIELSAVTSGVKDIRQAMAMTHSGVTTIVFVDEVHRFNKSQQDAFLPFIESGAITFIGATTENPSFSCNNALLSRCRVYVLQPHSEQDIIQICLHALTHDSWLSECNVSVDEEALMTLASLSSGDARRALLYLELAVQLSQSDDSDSNINQRHIAQAAGQKIAQFDQQGDYYYDVLSAFHKSVRGSSSDGALYWYARYLNANSDPIPIMRRLLAIATEDIGLADPRALTLCLNAWDTYHRVGAAEGERAIAQACVYCALAPKSNALYCAFKAAKVAAQSTCDLPVPNHLRNAPTTLAKSQGHGDGYRYSHNEAHAVSAGQHYLPDELADQGFFQPSPRGLEQKLRQKQEFLDDLNKTAYHNAPIKPKGFQ